jgi:NAD(P)-dependent dehydrogenase (short-subunit alcohol dehydrogenase family)
MGSLDKQVAIVTGASTGIGRSIAIMFAKEGASVVVAARRRERLEQVVNEIEQAGGKALVATTDITVEEQVIALFEATQKTYGRLDILINNAGTAVGKPTDEMTLAEWRSVIDCNLTGAFLCSREALKLMKPRRSGRIVNIGSTSAKMPRPNSAPYTTSKYGLEGLTHSLAVDGRNYGVAASVLQPGNVVTDIWGPAEHIIRKEGAMSPDDLARIALLMVTLPADINLYQALVLPLSMPFLGRG